MAIKIINTSDNPLPAYETALSAGMDLRANLSEPVVIGSLQRSLIPTGLFIALEPGTEAQIRPRSGLAFKQGLTVLNTPGTIDADYRGELKVLLVNLSDQEVTIQHGDRIAQMVIAKHERPDLIEVESLDETARGEGGFGSTGVK
jgi:dUTP pyrophosphatase